jgi:hypothetical protein
MVFGQRRLRKMNQTFECIEKLSAPVSNGWRAMVDALLCEVQRLKEDFDADKKRKSAG